VDERGVPLQGAKVDFSCNDLSPEGTSNYQTMSGPDGLFAISGIRGKLLVVNVAKEGYYTSREDNDSFYYAGQNSNFTPDPANPVLFHLRKKGVGDQLIHLQAGIGGPKDFIIPRDGTPVEVSLRTGKAAPSGQGDLRVQCWTDDQGKTPGQPYNWKCRIAVPGGGIVQYADEFPFQAPLDGYVPTNEICMPATMEATWSRNVKRTYFLRLADGNYARMNFEIVAAGGHFFSLESFLNPSGSRNLEFDPSKAITP
jgi:hypothetical protein